MLNRFSGMTFQSPLPSRMMRATTEAGPRRDQRLTLTPIIEEMSNLRVTSTPRHRKQDSALRAVREEVSVEEMPSYNQSEVPLAPESKP